MSQRRDASHPTAESAAAEAPGELGPALRRAAAEAARRAGGAALVFVADAAAAEPVPRLRAAGGFRETADARAAASALALPAGEALRSLAVQRRGPPESSQPWTLLPLAFRDRALGVLAVSGSPDAADALARLAESLALRLDHARLERELEAVLADHDETARRTEEKGEEILKLSEALFEQDIELLRNNEKLGKIEKLKNDFIEKMSRELRTPLNSIIEGIIGVLAGENEGLSEGSKRALRTALDEGTVFLRTLQNILDLWRIKQGELGVEVQDVNLREVVDEAIFSVQDGLAGADVAIENRLGADFPKIRTDLAKINQILFLLLDNAVKFTRAGRIEIRARLEGDALECSVSDTGIGVCPDDRQFIFDEFFQVDELASATYRGAGLGLALARDLLTLLDGEISLESEVGQGTTFTLRLPVALA